MLCQPLEDSLQRKEDIIKVMNGPIFVTINTKLLQIVLLYKNLFMKFTSDIYQVDRHLWLIKFSSIYTALNHNK